MGLDGGGALPASPLICDERPSEGEGLKSTWTRQGTEDFLGPEMAWGRAESSCKPHPVPRSRRVTGAV
jgi:hypothetical protein